MSAVLAEITDDQILERRLWNWADWARQGERSRGRCGSAERRWRPTYPEAEPMHVTDEEDAQRVEAAICRLSFEHREIIKGIYVYRARWEAIQRTIKRRGMPYWSWLRWVAGAKAMLRMELD